MAEKISYEMEFVVNSSPTMLYKYLSTPSGLSGWFANNVNSRDNHFTFYWERSEQSAELISKKKNEFVRFRWEDDDEESFFEFKIQIDDLTKDIALIITDFADDEEEVEENKMLWESQVNKLKGVIGG